MIGIKERLKELYLSEEECENKRRDLYKKLYSDYPNLKKVALSEEAYKQANAEQLTSIKFKIGCEKIVDAYLHYDFLGYDFEEAAIEYYEYLTTSKNDSEKQEDYSDFVLFTESCAEECLFGNFKEYAKTNPNVMYELNERTFWDREPDPFQKLERRDLSKALSKVFYCLRGKEEKVLKLYYGFDQGQPRTLKEVGKIFDLSRERIRQIKAKAERKIRHPYRAKILKDYIEKE